MSAEVAKQLKIKSGVVTRLRKEYQSYEKEVLTMKTKITSMPTGNEQDDLKLKKQREFLDESETVLSNVKHKLVEAYEDLDQFYNEKSAAPDLDANDEMVKAKAVLQDTNVFLTGLDN